MSTRFRFRFAVVTLIGAGVTASACSDSGPAGQTAQSAEELGICFGDSGICFDAAFPTFDAAIPSFPDANVSFPHWPDGGGFSLDAGAWPKYEAGSIWKFDAAPSWTFDGGGSKYCSFADPKYSQEYHQAVANHTVKSCLAGCSATECCYWGLSCVAQ